MRLDEMITTKEARISLVNGLARMAKADGMIHEKERAFFESIIVGLGLQDVLEVDRLLNLESDEEMVVSFDTSEEKMFFVIQAVQLSEIDGSYSEEEKNEIRQICKEIGVSIASLEKVEAWVREGIEWNSRGDELLKLR